VAALAEPPAKTPTTIDGQASPVSTTQEPGSPGTATLNRDVSKALELPLHKGLVFKFMGNPMTITEEQVPAWVQKHADGKRYLEIPIAYFENKKVAS
jgi:hypothetical protein